VFVKAEHGLKLLCRLEIYQQTPHASECRAGHHLYGHADHSEYNIWRYLKTSPGSDWTSRCRPRHPGVSRYQLRHRCMGWSSNRVARPSALHRSMALPRRHMLGVDRGTRGYTSTPVERDQSGFDLSKIPPHGRDAAY
jgi:hypothetical protein